MAGQPLAFLLTWTCYGAWLHGDARGSIDSDHNSFGTDLVPPRPDRVVKSRAAMTDTPIVFTGTDREIVDLAIREHCEHRDIWLGALNVRSNHVHCVVGCDELAKPDQFVQRLKSWATRALRAHDKNRFNGKVWTRYASTRYLWKKEHVDGAVRYVLEGQDRPSRWLPIKPEY